MSNMQNTGVMSGNAQTQPFVPLGRTLRKITEESKSTLEIKNITDILTNTAKQGVNSHDFEDLRDVVPTMIMNGTLNTWLAQNELTPTGAIDQTNGNYKYTISW